MNTLKCMFLLFPGLMMSVVNALPPGKLPNGEVHRYTANQISPSSDLMAVGQKEACFVAKHWMNNIDAQVWVQPEDKHIVKRIHRFCEFVEQDNDPRNVYLIWVPKGVLQNILFIILIHVNSNEVIPRFLVQSPFWDSSQIDSQFLKEALQHLAEEAKKELNLETLYKNDPWYKLGWNWEKENVSS